jgi:hypothetical protein
MTLIDFNAAQPSEQYTLDEIEAYVADTLDSQLRAERDRMCAAAGATPDVCAEVLAEFADWADEFGLPTTGSVLATFLVEMYRHYDAELDDLEQVEFAYMFRFAWNERAPIVAALKYCASMPRAIEHDAVVH